MFDKNGHTPDVSVVFVEGRYHTVYDWGEPNFNGEGGLAYAWAEKPEGPWHRDAQPITRNSTLVPLLGRYRRTYAATLLRRKQDVPHEAFGIWGQTFAGWVDPRGVFQVLFPSRNPQGNGTINLASRPWSRPLRERGFHLTGHQVPSLTLLRCSYREFTLEADLRLRGTARIMWGYQTPLGPNRPASDATLHPLSLTRHQALELSPTGCASSRWTRPARRRRWRRATARRARFAFSAKAAG